jgi:hypothetical protein
VELQPANITAALLRLKLLLGIIIRQREFEIRTARAVARLAQNRGKNFASIGDGSGLGFISVSAIKLQVLDADSLHDSKKWLTLRRFDQVRTDIANSESGQDNPLDWPQPAHKSCRIDCPVPIGDDRRLV